MRTSRLRLCTSAVALLVAALVTAPARADEPDTGAQVEDYLGAVERGAARFEARDYEAARAAFLTAYAIHPEPVLLFNVASTYRRERDLEQALVYYRRFLSAAPKGDPRVMLARETIAALEDQLAEQRRMAELAAQAARDAARDRATRSRIRAAAAPDETGRATAPPSLSPPAGPAVIDRPGSETRAGDVLRWTGVTTAAVGALGVGASLYELRRSRDAGSTLGALPAGTPWDEHHEELYRRGQATGRRALVLAATGGTLVITGVALFVAGERRASRVPAIGVTAGGRSAGFVVRGTW